MFWSGTLLNATGPLAKAWLSANMERKLSKTHILQHNLQDSVDAIITPNQAPMALRLSGQLLLGVVRIYGRKARYLLDDCNEALVKIKMAFRSSGNHDIPANLHVQNKEALMLPDRITPYDNLDLLPPPDASWLSSQIEDVTATPLGRKGRVSNRDINLQEDFNNSQFLNDDLLGKDDELALGNMDDLELDLDFGMDLDEPPTRLANTTIEMGRDAPAARPVEDDMFSELDMQGPSKGRAEREPSLGLDLDFGDGIHIHDEDGDIPMGDDDFNFDIGEPSVNHAAAAAVPDPRARISESPLSDVDDEFAREVELEYSRHLNQDMYEPGEDSTATVVAPQRRKKTKLLQPDEQTMLSSAHIKEQQARRDNILKPQSFLSRDPYVLGLLGMQKSGDFINSVLREGRNATWAPELRGLLSITAIRPQEAAADRKRKRDSGIADMDSDEEQGRSPKSPRLDIPDEDTVLAPGGAGLGNNSVAEDGTILDIPAADDDHMINMDDDDHRPISRDAEQNFDETTAPLVHPADSGPVSIATKHAVHILRDLFGPEAEHDADKRKKASVVFQDLLPENRTSKADATKMFFECLVLATKDAIKVDQPEGSLGGPIRVRGKRGLWGDWAEREAGGEIAADSGANDGDEAARNEPESAVQSSAAVAVEA
ncbi:double-strand-break repair protein rad21 [Coniochaeta ligniaria NRRL 30616]|uniref:Double-strand-break repair protein rad21 n=1 Tax=Coniochaeta ligniaria NRRL 30616 TaxID=1408157 RepID=A0A1J7J515_9PEZI|nr:double-strand-break repair protein rad21 [Coniochaeta ligniaria NRRL 30616]